jgi:hypothetical protein
MTSKFHICTAEFNYLSRSECILEEAWFEFAVMTPGGIFRAWYYCSAHASTEVVMARNGVFMGKGTRFLHYYKLPKGQ